MLVVVGFLIRSPAGAMVLVIYPEAPEPFREAFAQLITGITATVKEPVESALLAATATERDLASLLESQGQGKTVVLLGQKALKLYERGPPLQHALFVGGVDWLPGQTALPGVSLAIHPQLYLQMLREVLPHLRKIFIYYNVSDRRWMDAIRKIADDDGLDLVAIPVSDVVEIARQLGKTIPQSDPTTTAHWFGRDTIAYNTEFLYPYLLEQSWDRHLVMVSETIAHVRRGFLFAFYPNYLEVGKELGALIAQKANRSKQGLQWTQAGQLTLNSRTARHLGIELTPALLQRAKPVFPEP